MLVLLKDVLSAGFSKLLQLKKKIKQTRINNVNHEGSIAIHYFISTDYTYSFYKTFQ